MSHCCLRCRCCAYCRCYECCNRTPSLRHPLSMRQGLCSTYCYTYILSTIAVLFSAHGQPQTYKMQCQQSDCFAYAHTAQKEQWVFMCLSLLWWRTIWRLHATCARHVHTYRCTQLKRQQIGVWAHAKENDRQNIQQGKHPTRHVVDIAYVKVTLLLNTERW